MNLFELNTNTTTMNIDGKDIEMKPAICYGKEYDKWLVSECGKVWSLHWNKMLLGSKSTAYNKGDRKTVKNIVYTMTLHEEDWWGDSSSRLIKRGRVGNIYYQRPIRGHKLVMDTWKPLYDNPPVGVSWETWEKIRDYSDNLKFYSESVVIDHVNDDTTDNHIDNLRRVTQWDNNPHRKKNGI